MLTTVIKIEAVRKSCRSQGLKGEVLKELVKGRLVKVHRLSFEQISRRKLGNCRMENRLLDERTKNN